MDKGDYQDYQRNLWVQRKLHSLILDGYQIRHSRVEVQPGTYVWVLVHRNGKELHLKVQHNVVSLENKHKVLHIETF